jgi:hypothetical protein
MPAAKKPPGTQQDRRPQRPRVSQLAVVDGADRNAPPAPKAQGGLLKSSVEAWDSFWTSVGAGAAVDVDLVVAERWILARDEWQRALNAVRRCRLVKGSTGQPVLNPLTTWVASREAVMQKCEQQLGIGPKFRMDLGIAVGQARMTAAELNRMTEEPDGGSDEDTDAIEAEVLAEFGEA